MFDVCPSVGYVFLAVVKLLSLSAAAMLMNGIFTAGCTEDVFLRVEGIIYN